MEEKNEVEMNLQPKLVLENGIVSLPDPSKLIEGYVYHTICQTQLKTLMQVKHLRKGKAC